MRQLPEELQNDARLPTPARGLTRLVSTLNDEHADYPAVAKSLEPFPAIVARLISIANSSWSSPVNQIDSLQQACARIGMNLVRNISITLAVTTPFNPGRCLNFDMPLFLTSALLNAEAGYQLAEHNANIDSQSMRTAGLLYNIGLLWMAQAMPGRTSDALEEYRQSGVNINDALQSHCGIDYFSAGAALTERWEFPPGFVNLYDAMKQARYSDEADEKVHLLCIACDMISILTKDGEFNPDEFKRCAAAGLETDSLVNVYRLLESRLEPTRELSAMLV